MLERQSSFFRARNLDRPLAFIFAEQARVRARMGDRQGAGESAGELASLCGRLGSHDGFYAEIPILMAIAHARRSLACGDPEAALASLSGSATSSHGSAAAA